MHLKAISPVKAPLQTIVRAQEINKSRQRFDKELSLGGQSTSEKKTPSEKQSVTCAVL